MHLRVLGTVMALFFGSGVALAAETAHPLVPAEAVPLPQRTVDLHADVPDRHVAVYLILGFGTPVGGGGLEAVARWRVLEFAAGVGLGAGVATAANNVPATEKIQWALMPRLRLGGPRHAAVLGAGVSWGKYAEVGVDNNHDCPQCIADVVWANMEVGGELWAASGLAFRYFLGFAISLRASPTTPDPAIRDSYGIPYTGVGLGYVF